MKVRRKAFSYVRMSTPQQLKGDSLRRQIEASEQYARDNDLDLQPLTPDEGVSAFRGDNKHVGALNDFLNAVRAGCVPRGSVLIVESLDRLSREDPYKAFGLMGSIVNAGIDIVTLSDRQTYSAAESKKTPVNYSSPLVS